ncbi:hypothetical protein DCAR_0417919 [Daucus carota subsp. sativus]|uniref:Uncharacterized protein n=1 Tax=Daucus carota subsp. sativus TaxID=79200 RepID=A0AAF0X2L5_DAUCS|nr:hypothetical protein DCAR_0417919 [Daucus carota subsp. sativus]
MDPRYIQETSKHLEKQHELLWDTYRSMTHELQKLQVEEEMLMRKFYEAMSAQGLNKKASMSDNLSASPPTPTTSSSDLPATRR